MKRGGAPRSTGPVEVALAEYGALRSEILSIQAVQAGLLGVGLTAIGLIFTFALQQGGDRQLLHLVPFLALLVCILHVGESVRMFRLGDYIRVAVWPLIQQRTGYRHSWERSTHVIGGRWTAGRFIAGAVFDGIVYVIFGAVGAFANSYAPVQGTATWVGWVAVGLTLIVPTGLAVHRHRGTRRTPDAAV